MAKNTTTKTHAPMWSLIIYIKPKWAKGNELTAQPNINAIKFIQDHNVRLTSFKGGPISLKSNSERPNLSGATVS